MVLQYALEKVNFNESVRNSAGVWDRERCGCFQRIRFAGATLLKEKALVCWNRCR